MRRELIEALTYPRLLILKIIDAQDCEHDSLFQATSARCHHCSMGRECHWVSCLNDFEDLRNKPAHTLNASLRYSVRLVESLHDELRHDATRPSSPVFRRTRTGLRTDPLTAGRGATHRA